jgi:hypothetical protein
MVGKAAQAQTPRNEAEETAVTVNTAYNYTNGKYGTADSLPSSTLSAGLTWNIDDDWSLDVDLPYVRQTSQVFTGSGSTTRVVRIGGKPVVIKGTAPTTTALQSVSGQGDATLLLTRTLDTGTGPVWSIGSLVKVGSASADKGLGTGKADLSFQTGVANEFDKWVLAATAGFTFVGKPAGLGLRNIGYVDIDASYKWDARSLIGVTLSTSQAPVAGSSASATVTAFLDYKLSKNNHITASILKGFSTGSPSWGAGMSVGIGF